MMWNSPILIGKRWIKNRVVFPPLTCNWGDEEGRVTPRILDFYEEIASGGCGMIVICGTAVTYQGKATDRSLCLRDDIHLPRFEELVKRIRAKDCFASLQLSHVGGQGNPAFTGSAPVAPSSYRCHATGFVARPLSIEEISALRNDFVHSALLAARAGFQSVELHLAHGYLLHEFLSEHTNRRDDIYGGSIANRIRLILEIISEIRANTADLLIGTRISGEDYLTDGINEDVNKELLPILEDAGVEYFSVTAGIYDTSEHKHEAMKRGEFFKYSRGVKKIVNKPVIGVGKILDIESAERHLRDGDCDMVAIGRGLIADPMMVAKAKEGLPSRRCTECGECEFLRHGKKDLACPLRERMHA